MTEKQIIKLLKNQQLSLKALVEKVEAVTVQQQDELNAILTHLESTGIVGKHNTFYYLLKDQGVFLAKIIVKTKNFVVLKSIPGELEVKISGDEADQLLLGDLVYAKEFQQNTYHCLDYYKAVSSLKGKYSLSRSGKEQLLVPYLNECGKIIMIGEIQEGLEVNQGDLLEGDLIGFDKNIITVKVTKKLVSASDVGSDISMIVCEKDGRLEFPENALTEAKNIPDALSLEDYNNRTDFREHTVVTIDGDDAHDFDDAVEAKRYGSGYEITVHIADVTHYVKPNHPLDEEAIKRGTSIYVADRVIPMLPFELSNGICSLNPGVDRLVLSVTMDVDSLGNVFFSKVERGVIRSHGRLTYAQVNGYFEGKEEGFSNEIRETLDILNEAHKVIRRRRTLQGSMKLDSTELKFQLDENGMPTDVTKVTQGEAEMLIEDMMIIANCSIARMLKNAKVPVLYRVHEFPPLQKISILKDFLKRINLLSQFPKTDNLTGSRFNDFLASIKDDNVRSAVSYMVLRSMSKARYSPEELGHFGLSELDYCHFTSPIRRYPDDIIHRLVKDYLIDKKEFEYDDEYAYLENMGERMSDLEAKSVEIEREVDDLEAAKYMSAHIGEEFHGKVVSMVQRGMFIETDLGIEGFLAYHCMDGDYFKYNERAFAVFGKETDKIFTVGSPIDIKVLAANPNKREIDFATPIFYQQHALNLTEEERESLSLNGIRVTRDDEYEMMTGKPRFSYRDDEGYGERTMDNENKFENDENIAAALDGMDEQQREIDAKVAAKEDEHFTPSKEQWKEVDVIRAVIAKYPDDEEKVIQVLSVMDITEEEYRKLLRFTKPREDRRGGSRDRKGSFHGSDRRGGSKGGFSHSRSGSYGFGSRMSNRSERRREGGFDKKPGRKSFSDHKGFSGKPSFSKDRRDGGFSHDKAPRKSYGSKGSSRGGYGKKRD